MKRLLTVLTLIVVLMSGLQFAKAANPQEALVLYLPFDKDDGATTADEGPYKFDVNMSGQYRWVEEGRSGGAMEFTAGTATAPNDDRLSVEQITVMAWIFPTTISEETTTGHNAGNMIYDTSGASDDSIELGLINTQGAFFYINSGTGGKDRMGPFDGADIDVTAVDPVLGLETDKWYNIAGTFDGESVKLYIDGAMVSETAVAAGNPSIVLNDNENHIGGRPDNSKWFVGILDEFAIFDRALDENEIAQMMQSISELAVESAGKITNTWGQIKSRD